MDPDSLNPDGSGSRVLMTKYWKEYIGKMFKNLFCIKTCNLLISRPPLKDVQAIGAAFRALNREHPALQKVKLLTFSLFLWVTFALLEPYQDPESESGTRDPIESGSYPDPDIQIRFQIHKIC